MRTVRGLIHRWPRTAAADSRCAGSACSRVRKISWQKSISHVSSTASVMQMVLHSEWQVGSLVMSWSLVHQTQSTLSPVVYRKVVWSNNTPNSHNHRPGRHLKFSRSSTMRHIVFFWGAHQVSSFHRPMHDSLCRWLPKDRTLGMHKGC